MFRIPKIIAWIFLIFVFILLILINSSVFSAERKVNSYYKALIQENYEKAFGYLYLWEQGSDIPSTLNIAKAKKVYFKKTEELKKKDYKVLDVKEIGGQRKDGFILLSTRITIRIESRERQITETIQIANGKILIDNSDDPYVRLREGQMK